MTRTRASARTPEDLTKLFVAAANERDADGMAALYTPDAVLAFPPGHTAVGRDEIRDVLARFAEQAPLPLREEQPLPTVHCGDLALCSTLAQDGTGIRVQVAQRQPDGSWLRVIDRPESRAAAR
jgi:ketosteroid isomerase-like protein